MIRPKRGDIKAFAGHFVCSGNLNSVLMNVVTLSGVFENGLAMRIFYCCDEG